MQTELPLPPKPRNDVWRPDLTRLPPLTRRRRLFRRGLQWVGKALVRGLLTVEVHGLENYPRTGPALIVANHLGDADAVVGLALFPTLPEVLGKVELYDLPIVGKLLDLYGVIWLHRGQPDRRALRAAIEALELGRLVAIAPEGRQSVTGALEAGTGGAAYLALKTGAPVVPVAMTGTEGAHIYGNLRRFKRSRVSLRVGPPVRLSRQGNLHQSIRSGTETIMQKLAELLPAEYRGLYSENSGGA